MRVLAASDESKYSNLAIDYLKRLPCHEQIDLTIVIAAPEVAAFDLTGTGYAMDMPELIREQQENTLARLNESAAFLRGDFRSVTPKLVTGSPGREVCEVARKTSPDLMVAGAIGHSAVARVLLGSTSDYIATHADCPVLVVRPDEKTTSDHPDAQSPPQRVLIAIGNATSDECLWRWIDKMGLPKSTQVRLVHVMQILPFYEFDMLKKASAYWNEVRSAAAKHIDELLPQLQSLGYDVKSELVDAPHIGQALTNYIEIERCDLVILGDRRESLADRILLGSTSRHVLRHAKCSVLTVRQRSASD